MSSKPITNSAPGKNTIDSPVPSSCRRPQTLGARRYAVAAAVAASLLLLGLWGGFTWWQTGLVAQPAAEAPADAALLAGDDPQALIQAAIAEFERAIELEPGNPEGYQWLSKAYQMADQPEAALTVYRQAIQRNPDESWPLVGLGELQLETGDVDAAIATFQQAVAMDPDDPGPQRHLAQAYVMQTEDPTALDEIFEEIIAANPGQAWPHLSLGDARLATGNIEQAQAAYQQAIAAEPANAQVQVRLGDLYLWRLDQPAEAADYYRQAATLEPDSAWHRTLLASALMAAGQDEAGWGELQSALRLAPNDSDIQRIAGDLLLEHRTPAEARPYFEQAIVLDSTNARALVGLARVHRRQNNYEQALATAQQAETLAQTDDLVGAALHEQALSYQAQTQPAQALQKFIQAAETSPANAWFQSEVGNAYLQQDQIEKALPYFQQAAALAPAQPQYFMSLGKALLAAGQQAEGMAALQTALERAGNRADIYLSLGRLAGQTEDWPQVIQIYEQALAQGVVDQVDIYLQLGDAYRQLNLPDKAQRSYQQAAQLAPDHPDIQQRLDNSTSSENSR